MGLSLEICVPDIGDFEEVEVVELLVAKGDIIEFDDPVISIESDKATMEIPSTAAGVVAELRVSEGDRVSEGSVLIVLDVAEDAGRSAVPESDEVALGSESVPVAPRVDAAEEASAALPSVESARPTREMSEAARHPVPDRRGLPHASPLARRHARELGVPIDSTQGSGAHGRVLIDDLNREVRDRFARDAVGIEGSARRDVAPIPALDQTVFGPVHDQPLTRIQKASGAALHRSWLNVPQMTHHDEADVTELERFRRDRRELASGRGLKLSPLLFVMKAVAVVLEEFPAFRSSLTPEFDRLIVKDYFHLGISVDTDEGLVVPVIREVDRKGIFELAEELGETAARARAHQLSPEDLRGACFTISSLGGIGGTAFSAIVNAPETAILGLSKMRIRPQWKGPPPSDLLDADGAHEPGTGLFEPRLVLPLSLSYDHRVIDGASAARFAARLSRVLSEPLRLLL